MNNNKSAVNSGGNSMIALGVLTILLGVLAMLVPGITGFSVALLLGVVVVLAGLARIAWALQSGSFGRGLTGFILGALTAFCGVILLAKPLIASGVLTILLALYFLTDGLSEIVAGFRNLRTGGSWMLLAGVISLALGIMIWAQFPLSGVYAMGILLGIKLFFGGLIMIMGGSALRSTNYA
jgi:uncharacterized membrane protein HdeD (DUF308 family)